MSLDELREKHPGFGFAVYAMEPGASVTFEVHTPDGDVFAFVGATEAAAIESAFPETPEPEPPSTDVFA